MKAKWIIGIGVAGALILAGTVTCSVNGRAATTPKPAAAPPAEPPPISAEGVLLPVRQAKLAFKQAGRIVSVSVEVGQRVEAGATLATLDTADGDLAVRAAEDGLRLAQAGLAQLLQPPRNEELANLRAAVAAAEARLAQTRASLAPDEASARAQIESARARLAELEAGPRPQDAAIAESQLTSARLKLEQLLAGPRPEDVVAAEGQVRQAQARLDSAQAAARGGDVAATQAALAAAQSRLAQVKSGGRAEDVAAAQAGVDTARARLSQLTQGLPRREDVHAAELEVERARAALDQAVATRNEAATRAVAAPRPELDRLDAVVRSAQIGVEMATNALSRARAGANDWEVRQAHLAVDQALASLDKLKTPGGYEVEQAQAAVEQARANVEKLTQAVQAELSAAQAVVDVAQANLDKLRTPSGFDVDAAREAVRQAEAQLEKVRSVTGSELAAARAAVTQAQANLDRLLATRPLEVEAAQRAVDQARAQLQLKLAGAAEADLDSARARLAQAETALAQAKQGLAGAALTAPFAGTITQVSIRDGEQASPGTAAITIADLGLLRVETKDLDEAGAARVQVGQAARVTVHALGRTFPGKVAALSPQGTTTQSGDTNFTATIVLDQLDPALRWGQTAKVEFGR